MKITRYISTLAILLVAQAASAQFYVTGDDPGKIKWYSVETDHFEVIYPEGVDSLARVYAGKIESYRIPVSLTSGYAAGDGDGKKVPVVMHAYNEANGSVAWAPRRMDLYTIPTAYGPNPIPWSTMLSIHESRHVSQMQFGMTKALKPGNYIFGEMWNILASILYPGMATIEGDAVITETAWTPSGRGRTADFLNYYWVAFDNGDFRKWDHWRFVSQKHYAPNHYALGYLTLGGFRYLYDCPEYMSEGFHIAAQKPYNLGAFYTATRKLTGKKFGQAFKEVCDTLYKVWSADADKRRPYVPSEQVIKTPRLYTNYTDHLLIGDDIYSFKSGHLDAPVLVRIDSTGREKIISTYNHTAGAPQWSAKHQRFFWSESVPDARWSLRTNSKIRYIDKDGGILHTLDHSDMLLNPTLSNGRIAAVKYDIGGRSNLKLIDEISGEEMASFTAPDSLQLVKAAWVKGEVYVAAISDNGFGVYKLLNPEEKCGKGKWKTILSPQPVKIKDFSSYKDELTFTCDRTGVNEVYHLNPETGLFRQMTSTRYGAESFCYNPEGDWLYYSSLTTKGKLIFRTHRDSLLYKTVDYADVYKYPIAEKITAQEKEIAREKGFTTTIPGKQADYEKIDVSEPKRYRKFPHSFNIHSWAPVYVNVNNIMNMNFDNFWQAASLGAAGLIQNRLSTMVAEFGYSAHKDPYNKSFWRHSGHASFTYSGLYPVIEASVDFNDRGARQYSVSTYSYPDGKTSMSITNRELSVPYIEGKFSVYIPFKFSKGGWYKGITPKVTYRIGNDMFNTGITRLDVTEPVYSETSKEDAVFVGNTPGRNIFRHSLRGSLNAYALQNTPNSAVYPRWGFGGEIGVSGNIESADFFSPMGYAYAYGYFPGIIKEQGLKLSVMNQIILDPKAHFGQALVSTLPRGLSSNAALTQWLSIRKPVITGITADYAIPIYIGEAELGGNFFYIKRLLLAPHFDATFFGGGHLCSVGCDLDIDLHSILTLEVPCSFGVTFSYNNGSAFKKLDSTPGLDLDHWYVGPKFNVTF